VPDVFPAPGTESPARETEQPGGDVFGSDRWSTQPVRLRLMIGELAVGQMALPGLVLKSHFSDLLERQLPDPPADGFPTGIDVIKYPSFPTDSQLPAITFLPTAIRYVPARYRRYYIDMQGSFGDYLQKFSSKSRGNRRREVRRFEEFSGGTIEWRDFCEPGEMPEFHCVARQISRLTYQDRLLKSGLPDSDAFVANITEMARNGAIRGYVLYHASKPVSFIFCTIASQVILYRYIGYDPEYQAWSPGSVLLYLVLERLFAEGQFRMFDFTEGEGPHKELFANRNTWCADVLYCRRTLRIVPFVSAHSALSAVSRAGASVLRRAGLITRVRKLFRRTSPR